MTSLPEVRNPSSNVLVVTTDDVPGMKIERVFGVVRGNTVRARNVGHDFLAGLRNIAGGEVRSYTTLLAQSREQALDRLRAEAASLGANCVVATRFTTSAIMQGSAEILAYGTAVRITSLE